MAFVNCGYTGIYQTRRFHLSIGHGGVVYCQIDCLPQFGIPPADGILTVTDGIRSLVIPGCRIDRANIVYSQSGHIVRVLVQGPTWKWKLAGIDGVYNIPRADGSIEPGTERTPRELATLLFQAMHVPSFDVGGLPNSTRPFVNWRGALAFTELTALCHGLGCDFGLDVQGTIARIWTVGQGASLPTGEEMTIDYGGIDLGEPPDRIKAYCGPTEFQSKLLTECVMPDTDGVWKPIEEVSYIPQGGWAGANPDDPLPDSIDEKAKALAKKWLYRAYRAKSQADGSHDVPGYGNVSSMEDILPLHDWLVEHYEQSQIFKQVAYAEGTFAISGDPDPLENSGEFERIEAPHRLDGERGIIVFDVPIFKYDDNNLKTKADVYLVCSYNVRDTDKYSHVYYTRTLQIGNSGTGDLPLHRPDINRRVWATYSGASPVSTQDNSSEIDPEIDANLAARAAEFQTSSSVVKRYRGLIPVVLDGAIRQVSYFGSCTGHDAGCYTVAARNTEWEPGLLGRHGRRRRAETDRTRMLRDNLDYERRKAKRQGALR